MIDSNNIWYISPIIKPHYPLFRHGITFKEVSGEWKKVTKKWPRPTLPTIISKYKLIHIYSAVEFGLFYKALPLKIFHIQGQP